jgi:hypothetical protein
MQRKTSAPCCDSNFRTELIPAGMERCFPFFLELRDDDEANFRALEAEERGKDRQESREKFSRIEVSDYRSRGKIDISELVSQEDVDVHPILRKKKLHIENCKQWKRAKLNNLASIQVSSIDLWKKTLTRYQFSINLYEQVCRTHWDRIDSPSVDILPVFDRRSEFNRHSSHNSIVVSDTVM